MVPSLARGVTQVDGWSSSQNPSWFRTHAHDSALLPLFRRPSEPDSIIPLALFARLDTRCDEIDLLLNVCYANMNSLLL